MENLVTHSFSEMNVELNYGVMKDKYNPHLSKGIVFKEDCIVAEYLRDLDSSGLTENMNVDGSVTPVIYKAVPAAGKYWMISRLLIYLSDATGFSEDTFGAVSALTNGVSLMCNDVDIPGLNWKDNIDIQTSMFDADGREYAKLDKSISGRLSFFKFGPEGGLKVIRGFGMKIQDDLRGLSIFRARIEGAEYNKGPSR